ncbi:hypothetical protein NAL32_02540 [Chryseobacterium sp. Ch-15]|uniref:PDZ domain-containing protein n=1 Tax=Chryseobacterium muglaense TaxID=2893752 RepID=A0A9Q3UZJ6_9FLAO|nr:hypothetical protein [Chryseobacterium muglaense]MBD3903335.1 hypothetical protein [Chryseobacterium muglaense]MCC9036164.1 hypothetical protein [Chryseobacterium muglaense]MCM2553261.1 hypothetical protein [Chryseobacterium muglaense]
MFKNLIIITTFFCCFFNMVSGKNNVEKTLVLHLKPQYDNFGKANSMHVSYDVVFEDDLRTHYINLYLDLMQSLGRKDDKVSDLIVKDENGIVNINPYKKDTRKNVLVYEAVKPVTGKVTVEYNITAASPFRNRGSYIDMQASGGGLTGSFISILLLPPFENKFFVRLEWDLAEGTSAVSSFGVGNVTSGPSLSYGSLLYAQFIVGPVHIFPDPLPEKGFSVAGLGLSQDKIGNSLPKFQDVYEYLRKQFQASPDLAFRFFYRSYPEISFPSGSAVQGDGYGSFLLCIPPSDQLRDNDSMLALISHEMLHVFISSLSNEWFREGIAEYLSTILPYKGQFYTDEVYMELINEKAAGYYTNDIRMQPDDTDSNMKFSTANSWTLSYNRGFLYFADLDAKLHALTKGDQVTVLSLVLELEKLKNSSIVTEKTWIDLLKKRAGNWAVEDWKAMKAGKLITPYPGAFGKNFTAQRLDAGLFDLGFNKSKGIMKGQIISDLVKGSNAEKIGIKEGDEVIESIDLYPYYGSYDKTLTVKVKRKNEILSFSFSPRRGSVEAYHWVLAKNKK